MDFFPISPWMIQKRINQNPAWTHKDWCIYSLIKKKKELSSVSATTS